MTVINIKQKTDRNFYSLEKKIVNKTTCALCNEHVCAKFVGLLFLQ